MRLFVAELDLLQKDLWSCLGLRRPVKPACCSNCRMTSHILGVEAGQPVPTDGVRSHL